MGIMKRIHTFFLAFFLCFFLGAGEVKAQNAKARALGSMALYGTIGGSLLGTATLAFGNSARAIAQGASLEFMGGNKLVLQTNDTVKVESDVNSSLDVALTIMEVTP